MNIQEGFMTATILGMPDSTAFEILGIEIKWYAIIICAAIVLGFALAARRAKERGMDSDFIWDLFIIIIPLAIIGARLYYVLFNLEYYIANPLQIFNTRAGGMAIHGAVILGALGMYLYARRKKTPFFKILDILAPSLILGQAIGRWGNYFNMEAYGAETNLPWAIQVYNAGRIISVHPTFLYESLWNLLVFAVLIFIVDKHKKVDGEVGCWYFILYSFGRFFIEGLRTDSLYMFGLRTAQVVSIVSVIAGFAVLYLLKRNNDKNPAEILETKKIPDEK